jgi:hypothetical protein
VRVRTRLVAGLLVLTAGLAVATSPASAPAGAQGGPGCTSGSSVFGCSGPGGDDDDGGSSGGDTGTATSQGPPVDYERYFDEDGTGVGAAEGYEDDGCWGIRAVAAGEGVSYEEAVAAQNEQGQNDVLWGNCLVEETIDPAFLAQSYWEQRAAPPPPTPLQVQPGWAATGLPAYLEIGGDIPAEQSFATPIGTLTFTMTPRYVVTWGDGASTETTSQGGPPTGGDLTHTYVDEGQVTITVAAYWHATWSLAGAGGDLPELPVPTEGTLDLPVEQYQAVIDPS